MGAWAEAGCAFWATLSWLEGKSVCFLACVGRWCDGACLKATQRRFPRRMLTVKGMRLSSTGLHVCLCSHGP